MYNIRVFFVTLLILVQAFISGDVFAQSKSMGTIASEESIIQSCSLSIKIMPEQPQPSDLAAKATIEIHVLNRDGSPVNGNQLTVNASAGTFNCPVATDSVSGTSANDRGCFITNQDGIAIINLLNLPFNTNIKVKASTQCGDYLLTASGSAIITKKVVKKK